mmetsp:Transcript_26173/g.65815  ORF Transcript_26173/g.65815 Transcript_26173/m.65815 type:complete len:205 (-) Transcript_26173:1770-2384(-)
MRDCLQKAVRLHLPRAASQLEFDLVEGGDAAEARHIHHWDPAVRQAAAASAVGGNAVWAGRPQHIPPVPRPCVVALVRLLQLCPLPAFRAFIIIIIIIIIIAGAIIVLLLLLLLRTGACIVLLGVVLKVEVDVAASAAQQRPQRLGDDLPRHARPPQELPLCGVGAAARRHKAPGAAEAVAPLLTQRLRLPGGGRPDLDVVIDA